MIDLIPRYWYNIVPDLNRPLPPPLDPEDSDFSRIELLNRIIPKEVLRQQFTAERYVKIPDEVIELYSLAGRPTPLMRAKRLEELLDTPAKIYFKYEGATHSGSHKINTAIPQAYFAREEGVERVVTETGAGQWGTAVALSAALMKIKSTIFMVRVSYEQKPGRKTVMKLYGAEVYPSPSEITEYGKNELAKNSANPGSLGIAMSEAIEYVIKNDYRYLIGSVLEVVLLHQSIIGLEAIKQFEFIGEEPEVLIGCVGGGSNFAGFAYPFIGSKIGSRYIAVSSSEIKKFSKGVYEYDFPDSAGLLPMLKMITLGKDYVPPPIYSGGLRYHGLAPTLSLMIKDKIIEWMEFSEKETYSAAKLFANAQGIIPAPESAHAISAAIKIAKEAKEKNEKKIIAFNLSGHGLLDLSYYQKMEAK
ncbi:MAG: TrpB-like pyridoxal phosphate-dependent enzyme [Nitrososphaeria archaeon]|nr:TrpB-like pyridoxal phosphate-dependent enzyme [Conexivisphaerales archaeon]